MEVAIIQEELVAEMGASFLCGFTGIENTTIDNSAAYINNWLKALKGNKKLVVTAATQAEKACNYILDIQNCKVVKDSKPVSKEQVSLFEIMN